mgnify:CR=1 FL=1
MSSSTAIPPPTERYKMLRKVEMDRRKQIREMEGELSTYQYVTMTMTMVLPKERKRFLKL